LHELVGFLVCLFSCCILYFVYDLIIINITNNNSNGNNHYHFISLLIKVNKIYISP